MRPASSQPPLPITDVASVAGPSSTKLGGSPPGLPSGLRSAAQTFEHLSLNILAPSSDELVGMLDYDHESLHDILNVQVDDSSSDSGSHHPSQECFMADTPEGHVQPGSGEDNPSATPNTGTVADVNPRLLRQNPTPEQIRARQLEVAEAKRQLEHEHQMLEQELARGQRGGRARARAREVHHRIMADNPAVPILPRASENVAAAAAIFQNLPEPDTPEGRQAHH